MNGAARDWGPWSVWKTELILGAYLPYFLKAGAKATHRVFIDCFAGAVGNTARGTGRSFRGSPELALDSSNPEFTHLVFHELPPNATALDAELRDRYPGRRIKVIPGDCNDTIGAGLTWLSQQGTAASGPHLGQALAYLDPDNHTQLGWNTIETLAKFSRRRSSTNAYIRTRPIELLILFPTGTMRRCLPVRDGSEPAARSDVRAIDRLFGSEAWKAIYEDQRQGILTGDNGWRLYVDLFRDQLEDLGYRYVSAIETRNTKNGMLYHMVSASGSDVGAKIMRSVLNRASELFPQKIEEAKKLRGAPGTQPLFDPNEEDIAFAPDRYAAMLLKPPVRHELGMIETVEVTTPRLARRSGSSDDGQLSMDV